MPVVALESRDMPTQYKSTKPRPHFQILRWKMRDNVEPQQLLAEPEAQLRTIEAPSLSEKMGYDKVPDFNDPIDGSILDAPKAPDKTELMSDLRQSVQSETAHKVTRKGVTKISTGRSR
jgi:hypothetical protein